jgi:hypothetical protein
MTPEAVIGRDPSTHRLPVDVVPPLVARVLREALVLCVHSRRGY